MYLLFFLNYLFEFHIFGLLVFDLIFCQLFYKINEISKEIVLHIIVSSKSGDKTMSNEALFVQNRSRADSELWLPASFWINEFELTLQNIQTTNKVIVYDENSYGLMKKMLEVFK